jgi:hypothetical protein
VGFIRRIGVLPYLQRFKKEDILNIISETRFTIIEKDEIAKNPVLFLNELNRIFIGGEREWLVIWKRQKY